MRRKSHTEDGKPWTPPPRPKALTINEILVVAPSIAVYLGNLEAVIGKFRAVDGLSESERTAADTLENRLQSAKYFMPGFLEKDVGNLRTCLDGIAADLEKLP